MEFKETIRSLEQANDDPETLARVTHDALLSSANEPLRRAVEAAAIPHWFDATILETLLDEDLKPTNVELFGQVIALPFCESFSLRNGYNVRKALRSALRKRLLIDNPQRFRLFSNRATIAFASEAIHDRIERVYHHLWMNPESAGPIIRKLEAELRGKVEDSVSFASALHESTAEDAGIPPLVAAWALWVQVTARREYLDVDERLEFAFRCLKASNDADSPYASAVAAELVGDVLRERDHVGDKEKALGLFQHCVDIRERLLASTPKSVDTVNDLRNTRQKLSALTQQQPNGERFESPSDSLESMIVDNSSDGITEGGGLACVEASAVNHATWESFLFLSAVTDEFGACRKQVCAELAGPGVWVETQETFLAFGDKTLIELDNYVQKCDAVIHLVGRQGGSVASSANQDAIRTRYADLPRQLGVDEQFLRRLTYTQWEAWLAVLHGKSLFIAPAALEVTPDKPISDSTVAAKQLASQDEHLEQLRKKGHYPSEQLRFSNPDKLTIALQKNVPRLLKHDQLRETIEKLNRRFAFVTNFELINEGIERQESEQVLNALESDQHDGALLVAAAGYGKSCVLAQVMGSLKKRNTPFAAFKLDSVPECTSADRLGRELELPESPASVLAHFARGRPCVLIVDQLDAISTVSGRKTNTWIAFEELKQTAQSVPRMKLVVACRDFDLVQDHRLRPLGADDSGFKKVVVAKLSEEVVRHELDLAGHEQFMPSDRQKEILSLPFHLFLFLQGYPERPFSRTGDLYDAYWDRKTTALRETLASDVRWNETIEALTTYMSNHQSLIVPKARIQDFKREADAMVSAHVLIDGSHGYQFFHESFFDYAYARRFCSRGQSLVSFLTTVGEEQHLFRRAQLRQILGYRRENDPGQYYRDLKELLSSELVRFHIKRMIASEFHRTTEPRPNEWDILQPYLLETDLSRYVSGALRNHVGWFDCLDGLGVWKQWLASSDKTLTNAAVWYLEAHKLHTDRSARIAELLEPYAATGGEWDHHLTRVLSWGVAHRSSRMTQLYFSLIERGVYDDDTGGDGSRDFWGKHHNAEKENPRFIVDLLRIWLARTVKKYDDGESWNFFDKCQLNNSHTGSLMVGKAAADEPAYFIEQILPIFVSTVLKTEVRNRDRLLNRAWPYLSNLGEPFDINDAVLINLCRALGGMAKNDVAEFQRVVEPLKQYHHETICYVLLSAYAENPQDCADECIQYLLEHKPRLNIGYGSWSGTGEGHGESAISRMAIKAVSPVCDEELLRQLEDAVIEYCDDYEKSNTGRRGFGELLVLRSIDPNRRSRRANVRIDELECSFPNVSDIIPPSDESAVARMVGPPIERDRAVRMTDDQWILAMSKYDGSTDRFEGGPIELSRLLADFTQKDRLRFANLALSMPAHLNAAYFSAILDGMTSRGANLSEDDKNIDNEKIDAIPTELFVNVIRRLHTLAACPCGTAIVHCIEKLSHRALPEELLDIVTFYAMKDPDPAEDIWQDSKVNYYGGDPYTHGINCVRGQAAMSISRLLFDEKSRLSQLRPAVQSLIKDPIISVRSCAIRALTPLLNFARDEAVAMFLECCQDVEALWSTSPFNDFIHYTVNSHYPQIRGLLQSALKVENDKAVENASTQTILADLGEIDTNGDANHVRQGSNTMRRAAAYVYAHNLEHKDVGDRAGKYLQRYFNDDCEEVRGQVSRAFWKLSGARLLELEQLIETYVESRAFTEGTDYLLRSLEASRVQLPHVVCRAAERILEFLGIEGTHISYRGSSVASSISKLVVRQYAQANEAQLKRHCLDLIDRMERVGYMGIAEELDRIDR